MVISDNEIHILEEPIMSDKVFQAIAELIAERNDSNPAEVTRDTRFQDVGIDSLDTVEMLMNLEDKIGVEVELSQKVETVGELVDYVVSHAE
ncbi:acyl carrier protein [human gut metagenome]|uniref:Acyl carrier protein n=1 Tax=human gut metagenome TaxID=408170 RepID=K1SCS2_9ZZZZ